LILLLSWLLLCAVQLLRLLLLYRRRRRRCPLLPLQLHVRGHCCNIYRAVGAARQVHSCPRAMQREPCEVVSTCSLQCRLVLAGELAFVLWLVLIKGWGWIPALLAWAAANLVLSGILLRVGGYLTKGPYLPETMAGLTKTTRALVGR
jgi:hypothetical protein